MEESSSSSASPMQKDWAEILSVPDSWENVCLEITAQWSEADFGGVMSCVQQRKRREEKAKREEKRVAHQDGLLNDLSMMDVDNEKGVEKEEENKEDGEDDAVVDVVLRCVRGVGLLQPSSRYKLSPSLFPSFPFSLELKKDEG